MNEHPPSPTPLGAACPTHGWLTHAALHEAAHAVFAVDHGIPFISVGIETPQRITQSLLSQDLAVAGGVTLSSDARECFPSRQEDALDFCLAGVQAEKLVLGHNLQDSYVGDFRVWRIGTGRSDTQDAVEIGPLLAASIKRVNSRLVARSVSVFKVRDALMASVVRDEHGRHTDLDTLILTSDEVHELLAA